MTLRSSICLALVAAIIVTPSGISAQQTSPNEPALWRTLAAKLEPAALVSVRLKDGTQLKGTVLGSNDDAVTIKPQTRIPVPARDIPFDEIVSLQREKPSMSPAKKVLLGVGVGAAVYFVLVAALLANLD